MDEPGRKIKINRQNPKSCEKFSGDLKLFLKKKEMILTKKLKSNQKILNEKTITYINIL